MKLYNSKTHEIIVTEKKWGFHITDYWVIPQEWTLQDAMEYRYPRYHRSKISLKDAFTKENILRSLRESTEDQRKILKWM